jgi:hypothetical protein
MSKQGNMKAEVEVDLQTEEARRKLGDLTKFAARQAKRAGSIVRRTVGAGLKSVGLGAGVGAGMAIVRSQTSSGVGDVFSEIFGGVSARLEDSILGDAAVNARADKSAREDTIATFGMIAGMQGSIPAGAKTFFDARRKFTKAEQDGRKLFEMSDDFRSTDPIDTMKKVLDNVTELVKEAFAALGDRIWASLFG